ncbi:MAG: response regulator, partial [Bacteroidia bacterium]|nr:response regulator [Bacteroidia bacterium]MDW8335025.1 response regulator [Bacteroidia bacterium]
PFSQVDASHTRRFGGTGLGLAICNRLVQLMGGKIRLDSEYTQGARFVFNLSFEIGRRQIHGPTQTFVFDPALAQKYPLQILVAEDNLINQKMIRMVLNRMGYRPVIVSNGAEAVELARRQAFDLIFMDVQMPEMDGITATREILKSGLFKPVIVAMTANAMSSDKDECLAAGMSGFISKPIRIEQVHEALVQFGSRIPFKHLN